MEFVLPSTSITFPSLIQDLEDWPIHLFIQ